MTKQILLDWLSETHRDACKDGDKDTAEITFEIYKLIKNNE